MQATPIHVESGLNFNLDTVLMSVNTVGGGQSTNMFVVGHYRTHFQYSAQQ